MSTAGDTPGKSNGIGPRILVVDHDILVRTVVAAYLRECGYEVVECGKGEEAVEVLQSDMRIDVVFAEVTLAGTLDGFGLAQWVRRQRPSVKVVLTAGSERTASSAGELCEQGPILAKPYDHAELARRIRSLTAR
jgi:DNA-binding response OmpR family regulator